MRVRSLVDGDTSSARDPSPDVTNTDSSRALRTFGLVALGTVVVAYVVSRFVASSDRDADASIEALRDRTADAMPAAIGDRVADAVPAEPQAIPIGSVGSDDGEPDADSDTGAGSDGDSSDAADDGELVDDAETNADLADEPSSTKITSGSSDEIQDRPAEPGEMSVDDDVEELVDEDGIESVTEGDTRADVDEGEIESDDDEEDEESTGDDT